MEYIDDRKRISIESLKTHLKEIVVTSYNKPNNLSMDMRRDSWISQSWRIWKVIRIFNVYLRRKGSLPPLLQL